MMTDEILFHIQRHFRFHPTTEQEEAIQTFARFLTARDPHSLMILTGSAGTGKTSIAGAIVQTLTQLRQKVVLMAPTGRAAKVFSTGIRPSPSTAKSTDNAPSTDRAAVSTSTTIFLPTRSLW